MAGAEVALAILGFSLGVEIGHQCVVLPLFGLTTTVRAVAKRAHDAAASARVGGWLLRGGSAMISIAGIFYLVTALEQIAGTR